MNWDEQHGWYGKAELAAGLYAIRDAAGHAADALEQLRQTTQYIQDHYGASGTDGTASAPQTDAPDA